MAPIAGWRRVRSPAAIAGRSSVGSPDTKVQVGRRNGRPSLLRHDAWNRGVRRKFDARAAAPSNGFEPRVGVIPSPLLIIGISA